MRIALHHNLPSGGAKRNTYEQVKGLQQRGHTFEEFTLSSADLEFLPLNPIIISQHVYDVHEEQWYQGHVPLLTPYIHAVQGWLYQNYLNKLQKNIGNEINSGKFSLAYVTDCQDTTIPLILQYLSVPNILYLNSLPLSRQMKTRISDQEGISYSIKDKYYAPATFSHSYRMRRIDFSNLKAVDSVLTNSQFSTKWIKDHYDIDCRVVYPGINTKKFRNLGLEREDYVLAVGSLTGGKGYRFIVDALSHLPKRSRPRLLIAANLSDLEEQQVVTQLANDLEVRLEIINIRDDLELVNLYNKAQMLLFAPYEEPLGLVALEAMACGTPVVGVNEGGLIETIKHGETGLLVDRNPEDFASAISSLLENPHYRNQLGYAGIEYVRKEWTWEKAVDSLEQVFYEVCSHA